MRVLLQTGTAAAPGPGTVRLDDQALRRDPEPPRSPGPGLQEDTTTDPAFDHL